MTIPPTGLKTSTLILGSPGEDNHHVEELEEEERRVSNTSETNRYLRYRDSLYENEDNVVGGSMESPMESPIDSNGEEEKLNSSINTSSLLNITKMTNSMDREELKRRRDLRLGISPEEIRDEIEALKDTLDNAQLSPEDTSALEEGRKDLQNGVSEIKATLFRDDSSGALLKANYLRNISEFNQQGRNSGNESSADGFDHGTFGTIPGNSRELDPESMQHNESTVEGPIGTITNINSEKYSLVKHYTMNSSNGSLPDRPTYGSHGSLYGFNNSDNDGENLDGEKKGRMGSFKICDDDNGNSRVVTVSQQPSTENLHLTRNESTLSLRSKRLLRTRNKDLNLESKGSQKDLAVLRKHAEESRQGSDSFHQGDELYEGGKTPNFNNASSTTSGKRNPSGTSSSHGRNLKVPSGKTFQHVRSLKKTADDDIVNTEDFHEDFYHDDNIVTTPPKDDENYGIVDEKSSSPPGIIVPLRTSIQILIFYVFLLISR